MSAHSVKQISETALELREHSLPSLVLRYALMIALVFLFTGPFFWLLSIALRGSGNVYDLQLIPDDVTLKNFTETWQHFNFGRAFLNSVIVATCTVVLNVLFCSMAAYPLARMEFPGSRLVFVLILSTMMIPFQLFMIPLYLVMRGLYVDIGGREFALLDNLAGIVVPAAAGAMGIYMLKQYYETIPRDMEEAARIDGAGEFRIWWAIMVPLTRPALAALSIFVFVQSWSNFLWPLIVIQSEENYTLPLAVAKLSGDFVGKTSYVAAGAIIAILPIIIFFFALQRYFIGGLTLGSVKG